METVVLSGPADRRAQAISMLQQQGADVELSQESVRSTRGPVPKTSYNHGFKEDGAEYITYRGTVAMAGVVEPLGFALRLHWNTGTEGEWSNPKSRDPFKEIDELKARLQAAGIQLPGA